MDDAKLLLTVEEAAERLSIGRTLMYEHVLRGEIRSVRIGRCRRIASAELERFVDQLGGGDGEVADAVWRPTAAGVQKDLNQI